MGETITILAAAPVRRPRRRPGNAAIARCLDAHDRAYREHRKLGANDVIACFEARRAYLRAMPPLTGYQNIRDFVACTAYGVQASLIFEKRAAQLLHASQVAITTLKLEAEKAVIPLLLTRFQKIFSSQIRSIFASFRK